MIVANSTLMCSHEPSFQKGYYAMHTGKQIRWRLPSFTEVDCLMPIAQSLQTRITSPAIRNYGTARLDGCRDKRMQTGRRCIVNLFHAHPSDFCSILLSRNDNQCLIFDLSAPQTLFKTADIGFINFYCAAKPIPARPDHRATQFMKPRPCSFITAKPKNPFQTQRACTALLAGYPPDRPEPKGQGHPAFLKYRSAGDGCLIAACSALNKGAANRPPFAALTARTTKPIRPAQFQQIAAASCFRRKSGFKFNKGLGVVFHAPLFYMLG